MFTGIVEELGEVVALDVDGTRARLTVRCREVVADAVVGGSIAVDGCCLTVTSLPGDGFTADLMTETLRVTALGDLVPGARVHLERALRADGRLAGHFVQGHVDGIGTVVARDEDPSGTVVLTVWVPATVAPYVVDKGSVALAGTSLTVVDVRPEQHAGAGADHDRTGAALLRVALIPHTLAVTTFGTRQVGDRLNVEADLLAKHVARLVAQGFALPATSDVASDPPSTAP